MANIYYFRAGQDEPKEFTWVLDGFAYAVSARWNHFDGRPYLHMTQASTGELAYCVPVQDSPTVSLLAGFLNTPVFYSEKNGTFTVEA